MAVPKWLVITAEIDYWYFILGQIQEKYLKLSANSPIERMIDESTGYDKQRLDDFEKEIKPVCKKINQLRKKLNSINLTKMYDFKHYNYLEHQGIYTAQHNFGKAPISGREQHGRILMAALGFLAVFSFIAIYAQPITN